MTICKPLDLKINIYEQSICRIVEGGKGLIFHIGRWSEFLQLTMDFRIVHLIYS